MNVPKRGIGDVTARSLLEEAERNSMSLWELLRKHCRGERTAKTTIRKQTEQKISGSLIKLITNLQSKLQPGEGTPVNLVEIINQLLKDLQFEKHLEETHGPEYELRWANVQEFVSLAAEFMNQDRPEEEMLPVLEDTQQASDDDALARFLANVSLASDKQTDDKDKDGKPQVTVSTIHAAKGLEWPVVFIPAVYKGSIPHMRSDDDKEERRLLYVAMTRAQALLYLSCPLYSSSGSKEALQVSPFVENLPSSTFLKKGPSLDRPIVSEIARILRRELPSESAIYKGMPMMTVIEDNLYPVDPSQAQESSNASENGRGYTQRKRQKLNHVSAQIAEESIDGWAAPYATTMQRSASFTVPAAAPQPGFTTAGAHYASVGEAETTKIPGKALQGPATKRPPTNRAPSQRSLIGYGYGVTNHDKSKQLDNTATAVPPKSNQQVRYPPRPYQLSRGSGQRTGSQVASSAVGLRQTQQNTTTEPCPPSHKLGSAKLSSRPPTNKQIIKEEPPPKPKQYTCFSSSPTKPQPADELETAEKENEAPVEEQTRPAKSFHATTVNYGPSVGWRGGGIQKPAPLGRNGITPMDRLMKPFKLTVKRPNAT